MLPIVDGLEAQFEGQIAVYRLNAAEEANARLQNEYDLRGHPAIAVLDAGGDIVQQYFGPVPAETLEQVIRQVLN